MKAGRRPWRRHNFKWISLIYRWTICWRPRPTEIVSTRCLRIFFFHSVQIWNLLESVYTFISRRSRSFCLFTYALNCLHFHDERVRFFFLSVLVAVKCRFRHSEYRVSRAFHDRSQKNYEIGKNATTYIVSTTRWPEIANIFSRKNREMEKNGILFCANLLVHRTAMLEFFCWKEMMLNEVWLIQRLCDP